MNDNSNTYVIGDIHGNAEQLSLLITKIEAEIGIDDIIVFLGDYIDRGPNTKGVITQLLDLRHRYDKRIIFLRGNHELWFSETYHDHTRDSWAIGMDGLSTIRSYSPEVASLIENEIRSLGVRLIEETNTEHLSYNKFFNLMPKDHLNFLIYDLERYYFRNALICAHAGINPDRSLIDQTDEDLYWSDPRRMLELWKGPQTLVIGHRDTSAIDVAMKGKPVIKEHIVLLDTGNVITAVRFPDRIIIQSESH